MYYRSCVRILLSMMYTDSRVSILNTCGTVTLRYMMSIWNLCTVFQWKVSCGKSTAVHIVEYVLKAINAVIDVLCILNNTIRVCTRIAGHCATLQSCYTNCSCGSFCTMSTFTVYVPFRTPSNKNLSEPPHSSPAGSVNEHLKTFYEVIFTEELGVLTGSRWAPWVPWTESIWSPIDHPDFNIKHQREETPGS